MSTYYEIDHLNTPIGRGSHVKIELKLLET